MKQILHIFRKDTRHFWPEILASLLVTALCTPYIPSSIPMWMGRASVFLGFLRALQILVPLSWWLLIARATHDETLVGDEQFWITRPYEWKKLLAAKLLFIAAWIGVPYLLTQSYLLANAGFNPLPYIPGLLANLLVASALLLPLFAVAAVTANFARMTLTLLGAFVTAIAATIFFNTFFFNAGHGYQTYNPYHNHFFLPLILGLCAIAIALQYATRRVWLSRTILLVLPILVGISCLAYHSSSLVDRAYPQPTAASTPPMVASLVLDPHRPVDARTWQGDDFIDFSIQYSGIPDGYALTPDNFKFTLIAADGDQWTSPWQAVTDTDTFLPGTHRTRLDLKLSQATYDRFKSAPVTMHITLALSRLQSDTVTQISAPLHDTFIPGIGFCGPVYRRGRPGWSELACSSALHQPRRTYATTLWTSAPCSSAPPPPEATSPGAMWTGTLDSNDLPSRINSAINPIHTTFLYFNMSSHPDNGSWRLCPGVPITLTQYHLVDRTQSDITIPNFQLPANVVQTGY